MVERWRIASSFFNPKGIVPSSPRLPSQRGYLGSRLQRGCGECRARWTDGMAATALRLGIFCGCCPRVARAAQPWALGRNPVGIRRQRQQRLAFNCSCKLLENAIGEKSSTAPLSDFTNHVNDRNASLGTLHYNFGRQRIGRSFNP